MPPGWYPDPGHAGDGGAPERWWDGTRWTERTRTPPAPDQADTVDVPVLGPGPAAVPPGPPGAGRRRAAAVAGGALLLAALVTGAVLLAGGRGASDAAGEPSAAPGDTTAGTSEDPAAPGDSGTSDGHDPDPSGPGPDEAGPAGGPGEVPGSPGYREYTAAVGGAVLPVPDGWSERAFDGAAVTFAEHPCPADAARTCAAAGAFLRAADDGPRQARAAAEEDLDRHVAESYSEPTYGGVLAEHQELAEEVTVAGGEGYRVRRRVETGAGVEAYAETVAFPAPDGTGLLLLRLGWTAADDAPDAAEMTRLTEGIRRAARAG